MARADSMRALSASLEEARINEMNLRMELVALRAATIEQDSLDRVRQQRRIDSLRTITPAMPVVVEGDTLYYIYAKKGGVSPATRAEEVSAAILSLGKRFVLNPDSVYVESTEIVTELMYGDKVIASFTDMDGLWENSTRDELAQLRRQPVVDKLRALQREYGIMQLLKHIGSLLLVVLVQGVLIYATNRLYRYAKRTIIRLRRSKLKPLSFRNYELLNIDKEVRLLTSVCSAARYLLILIQLLFSIPILFSIFPQTKDLAYRIFSYIWDPLKEIMLGIVNYIPKLFVIIIIWLIIRYVVKGVRYLAGEIEAERLKINGFYPDWAQPSYQIIRFLLYAFMIAMIYPYLPGSDSGVFQGVSVFVGLIVSLGSSSVISNLMAGLVTTYMRPFRTGDRVKLNDTIGDVMERTPFVTRIKTPKNEVITIPNSFIMSSHTVNYSASARDYGLILHTEVSFGFEIHWKRIYDLLLEAARRTSGIRQAPAPFVLETMLHDFYAIYQINVYIDDASQMPRIYSDLNRHIQDLCNERGIELLSPHYFAQRDGNELTIPKEYKAAATHEAGNPRADVPTM
jgi:small-conductance mechanosensitive channel